LTLLCINIMLKYWVVTVYAEHCNDQIVRRSNDRYNQ
jgi:hypothetical protein